MMTVTVSDPYTELRRRLLSDGVLVPMGVDGLYGKGRSFVEVFNGLDRFLTAAGADQSAELYRFPPLIPRSSLVRTDYLRSFPDLIGSVHSFCGDDTAHAELLQLVESDGDWAAGLASTDVVLLPAACYPLYPMVSGALPGGGRTFDVLGTCFRHEPSGDPARMQIFSQREYVHIGAPDSALAFRDRWLDRAVQLMCSLGLEAGSVVANDPFFGRAGRMLAANQRAVALKFEVVATVANAEVPTAIASCNYHQGHLTTAFDVTGPDGATAHSACVGFGMERITLALFAAHGTAPGRWPAPVRRLLWP
jgi:seryl-tRNA synthetase